MKIYVSIVSVLLMASSSMAGLVDWSAGNLATNSAGITLQDGWLVAMYRDVSENNATSGSWYDELRLTTDGTVTSTGVTSDDLFLGFTTTVAVVFPGPTGLTSIDTLPNQNIGDNYDVYTVIFNAADMLTATQFVVADSAPQDIGSVAAPDTPFQYSISDISGTMQAIPEPAVATLISLFGGGMLFGRRIMKRRGKTLLASA